jgi:S1-C subfamily serine protease
MEIPLWPSAAVALAIFALLISFATAVAVAQGRVTATPVPVQNARAEEIGGAAIQNLNPQLAQELGYPANVSGVVVMDVNPSSPAGESGLIPGDVIVGVNNAPVDTVSELKDTIWWMGVTPVVFSVVRGGEDYIFTFPVW